MTRRPITPVRISPRCGRHGPINWPPPSDNRGAVWPPKDERKCQPMPNDGAALSPDQLFDLVADIERYPDLPWWRARINRAR